jgi:predicted transposase YdaD
MEVLRMTSLAEMFVKEGMQEGHQEGLKEGKKEGKKEGIKEGIYKKSLEIAKEMLNDKEPLAKIIKYTDLDEATVLELNEESLADSYGKPDSDVS